MSSGGTAPKSVLAAQLIYANVEAHESPRNARGFQTVFWTKERLDENEIKSEIAPRLVLLDRAEPESETVYFRTKQGRFVLARIAPPGTDQDAAGRCKLQFVHALVLDRASLRPWRYNPFPLLDHFPFFSRLADVREATGAPHGHLDAVQLDTSLGADRFPDHRLLEMLDSATAVDLLRLANRSGRTDAARVILGCLGNARQMLDFLRELFDVLPRQLRRECSIDALFVDSAGQSKGNDHLSWAVGLTPGCGFRDPRCLQFDPRRGRFLGVPRIAPETSLFETWLSGLTSRDDWKSALDYVAWAYEISAVLDGAPATADFAEAGSFVNDFLNSVRPNLEDRLRRRLAEQRLGPCLIERLIGPVWNEINESGPQAIAALARPVDITRSAEWLINGYLQTPGQRPSENELKELFPLVTETNNKQQPVVLLDAAYAYWQADWYRLAQAVGWLEEREYVRFARWALQSRLPSWDWKVSVNVQNDLLFGPAIRPDASASRGRALIAALLGGEQQEIAEASSKKAKGPVATRLVFRPATSGLEPRWPLLGHLLTPPTVDPFRPPRTAKPASQESTGDTPDLPDWFRIIESHWDKEDWRHSDWPRLAQAAEQLTSDEFRQFANWALTNINFRLDWRVVFSTTGELLFGPMIVAGGTPVAERRLLAALMGAAEFDQNLLGNSRLKHNWPVLVELLGEHSFGRTRG